MSQTNGVIRVGRKGRRKFAIGDETDERKLPVFEIDVVSAFQRWLTIDDEFREGSEERTIPLARVPEWHDAARNFVAECGGCETGDQITVAEALDFLARLREEYDGLADFFRPKSREKQESPASSEPGLVFSEEPAS